MFSKTATVRTSIRNQHEVYVVMKANEFKSDIWVEKNSHRADAKKLLDTLKIGIRSGETITFIADGEDETQAVETLVDIVINGYYKYFPNAE